MPQVKENSNNKIFNDVNEIVEIIESDGFFLNRKFSSDFRILKVIYNIMLEAKNNLPENYYFMIYEAYRPLERQKFLWSKANKIIKEKYPDMSEDEIYTMAATYVADPYNGVGSGHQACCSIDISLCDKDVIEYEMGTACQEINDNTVTNAEGISDTAKNNRKILQDSLENAGLINYPSEWWHFSYGDRLWSRLTGKDFIYGPIDI